MNRYLYLFAVLLLAGACKKNQDHGEQPLAVTSFFPTSGLGHTLVTVYGTGFGADTTHNTVTFNEAKATILQVTDTSLVVLAPDGGSTGSVAVTVGGKTVTAGTYTYQLLSLHSVSPLNGPAGTNVVISGAGLSGKSGPATVTFNGKAAIVVSSNDTSLVASVPDSAGSGPIVVNVDASTATGPVFNYQAISFITPLTGGAGTIDSIHGVGFGTDVSKDVVAFNGTVAAIQFITDTMIVVKVPANVGSGPVSVTMSSQKTTGPAFTVVAAPVITSVTPSSGLPGASVTIAGKNFSATVNQDRVDFNGAVATVSAATTTQLTVTIPAGATSGHLNVSVNGQIVQGPVFNIQALNVTVLLPNNGLDGTTVQIAGNGFSTTPANNQVTFNGLTATVTAATANQLTVTVPAGFTTGAVTVVTGGLTAVGPVFSRAGVKTLYYNANQSFSGIAVDASGNIYVTMSNNIMKMAPDGSGMTIYAGDPSGQQGNNPTTVDLASSLFSSPSRLAFDPQGNLYVYDGGNASIREITTDGNVSTVTAGLAGTLNGFGFSPQGQTYFSLLNNAFGAQQGIFSLTGNSFAPAYSGSLSVIPLDMACDGMGGIYSFNNNNPNQLTVYKNGVSKSVAGFTTYNASNYPAMDPSTGNVIVADGNNAIFYSIDESTGAITQTLKAIANYVGPPVDGVLTQVQFMGFRSITVGPDGAIYVIDGGNLHPSYIRKLFFH